MNRIDMTGKIALVNGASRGIGEAIARGLAECGATVVLSSRREEGVQAVADAIKASLDELPGSPRTQVGFLTYDDSVHYYSLKSGLAQPQMLVVADLVELFVPAPDDLLVNLQESRDVIDIFLENLPTPCKQ